MKKMKKMVRLERDLLLKLCCYFYQAMRSVHRAHGGDWPGFLEYYAQGRSDAIRGLIAELHQRAGSLDLLRFSRPAQARLQGLAFPGEIRVLYEPWLTRWKRSWCFTERQIHFMASSLQTLLDLLEIPTKPRVDVLISLRHGPVRAAGIIEGRCLGMPELKRACRSNTMTGPSGCPTCSFVTSFPNPPGPFRHARKPGRRTWIGLPPPRPAAVPRLARRKVTAARCGRGE